MSALPKLNFPAIRLRARRREGQVEVWDDLRGIYLVLTPEEWVRRHLIAYLVSHCGVLPKRVVQEYAVPVNGQPQRADVHRHDRPCALYHPAHADRSRWCWPNAKRRKSGSASEPWRRLCATIRCWGRGS